MVVVVRGRSSSSSVERGAHIWHAWGAEHGSPRRLGGAGTMKRPCAAHAKQPTTTAPTSGVGTSRVLPCPARCHGTSYPAPATTHARPSLHAGHNLARHGRMHMMTTAATHICPAPQACSHHLARHYTSTARHAARPCSDPHVRKVRIVLQLLHALPQLLVLHGGLHLGHLGLHLRPLHGLLHRLHLRGHLRDGACVCAEGGGGVRAPAYCMLGRTPSAPGAPKEVVVCAALHAHA